MHTTLLQMPHLEGLYCKVPVSFMAGTADVVTVMAGGVKKITADLKELCQGGYYGTNTHIVLAKVCLIPWRQRR
jgi:hypothetical protein